MEYIEINIFNLIGMNDFGYFLLDKLLRYIVLGYIKDEIN